MTLWVLLLISPEHRATAGFLIREKRRLSLPFIWAADMLQTDTTTGRLSRREMTKTTSPMWTDLLRCSSDIIRIWVSVLCVMKPCYDWLPGLSAVVPSDWKNGLYALNLQLNALETLCFLFFLSELTCFNIKIAINIFIVADNSCNPQRLKSLECSVRIFEVSA